MTPETVPAPLILASSSPYRAELLERLRIPFSILHPEIDESRQENESFTDLAERLAVSKALAIAANHRDSVVIGSDQVALHEGRLLGKPGNAETAVKQLGEFSGQVVQFLTSVALARNGEEVIGHALVETRVEFRLLGEDEIERYVRADEPYGCAGSFKAEALGASLFESVFSQDPSAIIGLPLIETSRLLRKAGFQVP